MLFKLHKKASDHDGGNSNILWITPGGGVENGECLTFCLERELKEELGLLPSQYKNLGHIWQSLPKPIIYSNAPHYFVDNYFFVQINSELPVFETSKWTMEEREVLKELKWWSLDELKLTSNLIAPPQLKSFNPFEVPELGPLLIHEEL